MSTEHMFYKNIMRIICHARSLDHTFQMFRQSDILKMDYLIDINTCIFLHKVFQEVEPMTSQNMFSLSSSKKCKNNVHVMF